MKKLKCIHNYKFIRNYTDEVSVSKGHRSLWICDKCGILKWNNFIQKASA